ncbi:3-deoxy-D-manno-octulosonic-acid transferase [Acinetobacter calcoaceticus]|uniref:3-deoxy-D-manno-octulosonic acid transferase n=1 Tax=Acinetobacter calcoaceticus TaxID=471 RepID=A0A4R1XXF9_ACICA|nr:3-deoxy-D-manno-octulosonic-acid transferase [Acinetobacter calcoaceticus]
MATPFWYNAALLLIKPLYKWRIKKRALDIQHYQTECLERFGPFQPPTNLNAIWFHAVSVGETNAAQPLIQHYLDLGHPVLVTNTTKTGQTRAKALFLIAQYQGLFQAVYLPADLKSLVSAFFQRYQPRLLALVETELWPNLIDQAKQYQVPCLLLNARLSEKSAHSYAKVPALTKAMLQGVSLLLAQDQASLNRFRALGLSQNQGKVLGSIKFDIQAPDSFVQQAEQLFQQWDLSQRKIISIASTHEPEEQKLLTDLLPYLQQHPEYLCIIAPRHPERFDEVFAIASALGLVTHRRSLGQAIQPKTQVYLADSMGELWLWYALSQVSFVGGSLNSPGGGHNILEPLAMHVPTVIGPHYFNFQSIVDELLAADAIQIGQDATEVAQQLLACLEDPVLSHRLNQAALQVLSANRGSLQQHLNAIDQYL